MFGADHFGLPGRRRYGRCVVVWRIGHEVTADDLVGDSVTGIPRTELAGSTAATPFPPDGLLSEGVERLDSGQLKVLDIAGDDGHGMHPRRCRNERVDHREGLRVLLTTPGSGDREGDR